VKDVAADTEKSPIIQALDSVAAVRNQYPNHVGESCFPDTKLKFVHEVQNEHVENAQAKGGQGRKSVLTTVSKDCYRQRRAYHCRNPRLRRQKSLDLLSANAHAKTVNPVACPLNI